MDRNRSVQIPEDKKVLNSGDKTQNPSTSPPEKTNLLQKKISHSVSVVPSESKVVQKIDVLKTYQEHCKRWGVPFETISSVKSPDTSKLFCTSGMQKHKSKFVDPKVKGQVLSDVQKCLRTVDLDEIEDRRHLIVFSMLGLFSFKSWPIQKGMKFWLEFVRTLGIEPTHITVHPEGPKDWVQMWREVGFSGSIIMDEGCKWSDGNIGGFCTEMYIGELEIGNIVNPLGDCLDCGFGLERLEMVIENQWVNPTKHLEESLSLLKTQGFTPGAKGHSFVVRQILQVHKRLVEHSEDYKIPEELIDWIQSEKKRQEKTLQVVKRLYSKHKNKSRQWWRESVGIDWEELSQEELDELGIQEKPKDPKTEGE